MSHTAPFSRFFRRGLGTKLHVTTGPKPSLALIIYVSNTNWKRRLRNGNTLSPNTCHASWSPLHSPSGDGCGQGELSRWCGLPKIELVMKKSTKWRSVTKLFWVPGILYLLWYLSIRKCEMPPWCFTESERLHDFWSFSLMRKQWYGTSLSLSSAVSHEIQPWYHACPCSSVESICTVLTVSTGSCGWAVVAAEKGTRWPQLTPQPSQLREAVPQRTVMQFTEYSCWVLHGERWGEVGLA